MKSNELENKSFSQPDILFRPFANLCDFLVVAAATTSPANWPRRQQNDRQITKTKRRNK
jgi:hypothetical protein